MSARSKAKTQLEATTDESPSAAAKVLSSIIERGARVQAPAVKAYVDRLRAHSPNATPAEIVTQAGKAIPRRGDGQRCRRGLRGRLPRDRDAGGDVGRRGRDGGLPGGDVGVRAGCRRGATAFPPIIGSAVGPWCCRYSSARRASTRWPTCSARAARAAPGSPTGRRRCRCPRCHN